MREYIHSNIKMPGIWHVLIAAGLLWFGALVGRAATYYVATNGTGNGDSWALATNNIQGAINRAVSNDLVLVSNGVYATGGVTNWPAGMVLTNRIAITTAYVTVRSANNDPANTIIRGARASDGNTNDLDAVRCVYMAAHTTLIGFTLTNGATLRLNQPSTGTNNNHRGGGVFAYVYRNQSSLTISNCVIAGNSCAHLGGGAYYGTLFNCTLIGNSGTGARDSILSNCTLIGNSGSGVSRDGGDAGLYRGLLYNCTLISNSAVWGGGGASSCYLWDCTLIGNSVSEGAGGGAIGSALYNCTLISNTATSSGAGLGAGASGGTLSNCTLIGNTARNGGGGVSYSTLYNCTLTGNSGTNYGGGANGGTLYNCLLIGNRSGSYGSGGVFGGTLYNCTIVSNSTTGEGGGIVGGTSVNSIVYFNTATASNANWGWGGSGVIFSNSCTTPAQAGWAVGNNITGNPVFVDTNTANYRLRANSPCVNAGTNQSWMATNRVDLDRRVRIRYETVDMGAYEFIHSGTIFGFQ